MSIQFTPSGLRKLIRCADLWVSNHCFQGFVADNEIETIVQLRHHPVLSSHCDYSSFGHLISEMNRRFSEHQKTAFLGLNLIPSILVKKPLCEVESVLLPLESKKQMDVVSYIYPRALFYEM